MLRRGLALLALLGVVLWLQGGGSPDDTTDKSSLTSGRMDDAPANSSTRASSPLALVDEAGLPATRVAVPSTDGSTAGMTPASPALGNGLPADLAAYDIGQQPWSDETFAALAARLAADPALRQALIDEFRGESSPGRLSRLTMLLAEVGGPDLVDVASDHVYSGDPDARSAGLELLRRLQPNDADARAVAIDLLDAQDDTALLVDAMNALSVPADAPAEQRLSLLAQVEPLAAHDSPLVRRHSLSVLGRWASDPAITPVLQRGLSDPDAIVRSAAAFALVDQPSLDIGVRQDLFRLAENSDEPRRVRSGAMLALQRAELDALERQRLEDTRRLLSRGDR